MRVMISVTGFVDGIVVSAFFDPMNVFLFRFVFVVFEVSWNELCEARYTWEFNKGDAGFETCEINSNEK